MTDDLTSWIGHRREIEDQCGLPLVRRVAALLDADPETIRDGDPLPPGWHVCLFTSRTRQSQLREDGHALSDPLMPPAPLPRRMLGGRRCQYLEPVHVGEDLRRHDEITAITRKQGGSGEMVIVTTRHTIVGARSADPRLIEEQDSLYLAAAAGGTPKASRPEPVMPRPLISEQRSTDTTLLFRYSAVTFNTHRIHYDLPYATGTEGYPQLVVNGGLVTLLLIDLFRRSIGRPLTRIDTRNRAAAHCGYDLRLCIAARAKGWLLWAETATTGEVLMEMNAQ